MIPLNSDFSDLLSCFLAAEVRFLLVGGYALAFHGHPRATKDIDFWVQAEPTNAARVMRALDAFGAPTETLTEGDLSDPATVFQIGVSPRRIDLVCAIDGVSFEVAWPQRETFVLGGLHVPVIGLEALLANKVATGRLQDLADAEIIRDLLARHGGR